MAEATAFHDDGVPRLALRGELDLADYDALNAEIRRLEAPGPRVLAIDLREVEYLDSTGVRWLVEAHERAGRAGRRLLVIHSPYEAVARVLSLCRLDDVLDLVEDAVQAPV